MSIETSEKKRRKQYSTLREYFVTTVVCTIYALFVTTYVVHPMTVPTPSMVPTILVGDRLLIDKFTIRNAFDSAAPLTPRHPVRRGDIVVFKFPNQPEVLYVKRAIGLAGETLEIRDKDVYIDGQRLREPYKRHSDPYTYERREGAHEFSGEAVRDNFGPVKIPPDSYFVMGDNRDDSADSRYFGFLPRSHVVGKPLIVFWSYADAPDAYLRSGFPDVIKLYAERVIHFFTRTRWERIGHQVK
ncbi:MAG: signal peptidase I [Acidobacteria bacterium]|nr:signal peptidase I [Acidobacteriota bacterium]